MKIRIIILLLITITLGGCFEKDDRVEPLKPGDLETAVIPMTALYTYQSYFDLESGQLLKENVKSDWDLGFEASDTGWHIILNTANFMWAANTAQQDFSQSIDTTGLNWKFDNSNGILDSTAIGKWVVFDEEDTTFTNDVYVINRGYDANGNLLGIRKVQFTRVTENKYEFSFGMVDDTVPQTFVIEKNNDVNFVFFSFKDGGARHLFEPAKNEWDLWFTQYTTILFTNEGDPYPYLVTGALINKLQGVEVSEDTLMSFNNISLKDAQNAVYSGNLDVVGYDWKDVQGDVQSGNVSYVVDVDRNYIIKTAEGFYFKLRFIDFYNNEGEKGFPTFEFQQL